MRVFLKVHLFLRKAVEFRAKVVGFYFEQVGLCIIVSAFDFQCFGFLQRKENFNKVARRKVARKTAEGGGKAREIERRIRPESKKKRSGT